MSKNPKKHTKHAYNYYVWVLSLGDTFRGVRKMGVAGHAHNVQVHLGPTGFLGTWMHPLPPPTVKTSGHMNAYSTFACYPSIVDSLGSFSDNFSATVE